MLRTCPNAAAHQILWVSGAERAVHRPLSRRGRILGHNYISFALEGGVCEADKWFHPAHSPRDWEKIAVSAGPVIVKER